MRILNHQISDKTEKIYNEITAELKMPVKLGK